MIGITKMVVVTTETTNPVNIPLVKLDILRELSGNLDEYNRRKHCAFKWLSFQVFK